MVDTVQQFQKTISLRILNYYIHLITLAWRGREKWRALRGSAVQGQKLREFILNVPRRPRPANVIKTQQIQKFQWQPKSQML